MNNRALPWMAASLTLILGALFFLNQTEPESEPEPPRERIATTAARAQAPRMQKAPSFEPSGAESSESASADEPPEAEPPPAPTGNPFAVFLDRPPALSAGHEKHPVMASLTVDDPAYDAKIDAKQHFAPFEAALQANEPLNAPIFKTLIGEHKEQNSKVLKRAEFLRASGHPRVAADLIAEWGRMWNHYQAQAYGRPLAIDDLVE